MRGLYIHIPFCVKKCDYCDFVSFPDCTGKFSEYIGALEKEMESYAGDTIDTVFVGGGTPSVLPARLIERLCKAIRRNFNVSGNAEWTIEINPGTISDEKITAMKNGGINRVSVGVQSFIDTELREIGRIHNGKSAVETVLRLNEAGFCNISIDLMMSLPYQTKESFLKSLDTAVLLPISHISVYSLIIEEGTPLSKRYLKGELTEPDEDADRELYSVTYGFLKEHGFMQYEISNYAKAGFESRHNLKYWNCDEYIGIGVSAHSYINKTRFSNTVNLDEYIKGNGIAINKEELDVGEMMGEYMMLGLRKTEGVNEEDFKARFEIGITDVYNSQLDKFTRLGLMEKKDKCYCLTRKGIDLSNSVMCEFL